MGKVFFSVTMSLDGCIAPEPLVELIAAGKAKDYAAARAIHDRLLPVTDLGDMEPERNSRAM